MARRKVTCQMVAYTYVHCIRIHIYLFLHPVRLFNEDAAMSACKGNLAFCRGPVIKASL